MGAAGDALGVGDIQMYVISVHGRRARSGKDFVAVFDQHVNQMAAGKAVCSGYECAHLSRHGARESVNVGLDHHFDKIFE